MAQIREADEEGSALIFQEQVIRMACGSRYKNATLKAFQKEYGKKRGKQIYYARRNKLRKMI